MQPEDFLKTLDERAKAQGVQSKEEETLQLLREIRDLLKKPPEKQDGGTIKPE